MERDSRWSNFSDDGNSSWVRRIFIVFQILMINFLNMSIYVYYIYNQKDLLPNSRITNNYLIYNLNDLRWLAFIIGTLFIILYIISMWLLPLISLLKRDYIANDNGIIARNITCVFLILNIFTQLIGSIIEYFLSSKEYPFHVNIISFGFGAILTLGIFVITFIIFTIYISCHKRKKNNIPSIETSFF